MDEIGKMEMFSSNFKLDAKKLLNAGSVTVLTTIPIAKGKPIPFVEEIRLRKDVELFTVSGCFENHILQSCVRCEHAPRQFVLHPAGH